MILDWDRITDLANFLWRNNLEAEDKYFFRTPEKIRFRDNNKNYYEKDIDNI